MPSTTTTAPRFMRVVVEAATAAGDTYRDALEAEALAPGFPASPSLDLQYFGGRTIEQLTFTNVYLGGKAAWSADDVRNIDTSLAAALEDPQLNNVVAQYFADEQPTTAFVPSRTLEGKLPSLVTQPVVESIVGQLDVTGFALASSVFCLLLPKGIVLTDGTADSKHGLGGYHGSVTTKHGTTYYAVAVYADATNGINAFDHPWKNVCAILYHELCEARTDPDVEDAIRHNSRGYLGWYSPRGGEIGDIPLSEAGRNLSLVMKEVSLVRGGTAPVQLMWSNAVGGPEGPIARKHAAAR